MIASDKKLAIIVPYRNRENHLSHFIESIDSHLKNEEIQYRIVVVEQSPHHEFNRGKLFNTGFDLVKQECDYMCFHDVDLLPENRQCDYSYVAGVSRLSCYVSQFGYVERPLYEVGGGITLVDKESYIKINGYSNKYWGWGSEDNDFSERCRREDISYIPRYGRYLSLPHEKTGIDEDGNRTAIANKNRRLLLKNLGNPQSHLIDGLKDLKYTVIEQELVESHIKYTVKLHKVLSFYEKLGTKDK